MQTHTAFVLSVTYRFLSQLTAQTSGRTAICSISIKNGRPTLVSGVPPDYFSETGQRWGNPLYRWDVIAKRGYKWWIARLEATLQMVDMVRIDHFRGFVAYWEIPASEPTAIQGRWMQGPQADLFEALQRALGRLAYLGRRPGRDHARGHWLARAVWLSGDEDPAIRFR